MMKRVLEDIVFGKMEYHHSWVKKDSLLFLGKAYVIKIIAQAFSNENISQKQRDSYLKYKSFLEENEDRIKKILQIYCQDTFNISIDDLSTCLTPQSILFEQDGNWAIFFDTPYEIENGIAIYIENNKVKVGTQDDFI